MTAARWGAVVGAAEEVDSAAAEVDIAAAAGADYAAVEMAYLADCSEDEFKLRQELFARCGLAPEVCLTVLPAGSVVTTPGFNRYDWMNYLRGAVRRLAQSGCRALLWRDGAARALPHEGDQSEMKAQAMQFVHMLCRLCEQHGVAVLVEPLPATATNYLNTMREAREFIALVGQDNLHAAQHLPADAGVDGGMSVAEMAACTRHLLLEDEVAVAQLPAWKAAGYDGPLTLAGDIDAARLQRCRELFA